MADFLLELRSEEIPARMQEKACADLARLFAVEIAKAGLAARSVETFATPRRLALIARGLPVATDAVSEEIRGPRADAPAQALAGFLGKTGLTREQLVERTDAKGNAVLFAVTEKPGRATAEVLADAIPAVIRAFPWPKSMRWGAASASTASLRWVRPLQGIVALLGDDLVQFEVDGIVSGTATLGHRFHHPGPITIGNADDYAAKLRACHVILDPTKRQAIIRDGAAAAAAAQGLGVVPDEGLVAENGGLTEWPVPLLGSFDPAFLAVPREVIQLTMRTNQKYFACVDAAGALAPAFVCTANIEAHDGGAAIVAGNRKVLAARLSDAKFFWEQDLKVPLAEWAGKLDRIVFHEKLGTVADKVERVAKLARWLVEEGIVRPTPLQGRGLGVGESGDVAPDLPRIPHTPTLSPEGERERLAAMAEQAARLAKADLVTGMVGEFPELQGVMGGYYARAEGLPDAVADAIRDHYKPVGQGDDVPTAPVTVAVSLADKLDTIYGFFMSYERPSGSRDPFALRRAALGLIHLLIKAEIAVSLGVLLKGLDSVYEWHLGIIQQREDLLHIVKMELSTERDYGSDKYQAVEISINKLIHLRLHYMNHLVARHLDYPQPHDGYAAILQFFADRLKVQQREAGVRHDLIDAVFALGGEDDLVRLLARVKALQAFVVSEDGVNLLAGYKRAANILRAEEKKGGGAPSPSSVIPAKPGISAGLGRPSPQEMPASAGMTTDGAGDTPAILSDAGEQGIAQTGEEDPLAMVEDSEFAAAVRELDARGVYAPEPAEAALIAALDAAEPRAAAAIAAEDFAGAMAALATLRAPIDAFFESVTVNDPDRHKRAARLALLARIRVAMHNVADFSKIEG